MDAFTGAAYLMMSEASFRHVTRRRGVAPVDFGGLSLQRWRKSDLDAMLASLQVVVDTSAGPGGPSPPPLANDPGLEALERARQRGRR